MLHRGLSVCNTGHVVRHSVHCSLWGSNLTFKAVVMISPANTCLVLDINIYVAFPLLSLLEHMDRELFSVYHFMGIRNPAWCLLIVSTRFKMVTRGISSRHMAVCLFFLFVSQCCA